MGKIFQCEVFSFNELSEDAKEKALQKFNYIDDFYLSKLSNTLKAFADIAGIELRQYDCSGYDSVNFRFSREIEDFLGISGVRLMSFVYNRFYDEIFTPKSYYNKNYTKKRKSKILKVSDCPLTGVCFDNDILHPILDALNGKYCQNKKFNYADLIKKSLHQWRKAAQSNYDYLCSAEFFAEDCEANGWLFSEDGLTRYHESEVKDAISA